MPITFDEILAEYQRRKEAKGDLHAHMRLAMDHFNGDIAIPMPEMDKDEKPFLANLMLQGLDQTAMRIASTLPNLHYPPIIPGKDKNEKSEDWAHRRKMANYGWWQESQINLKLRRMSRWLVGLSKADMLIRPNFDKGIPDYVLRNPLSTYEALNVDYDDEQPANYIYAYMRTFLWLQNNHPDAAEAFRRQYRTRPEPDHMVELLEYVDAEERVLGVVSSKPSSAAHTIWIPNSDWERAAGFELARTVNRAGICLGVSANRISVDKQQGQFDQTFGIYQNQAKLMALETIAVEKSIFPDIVIQGTTPGRTPLLINGRWADGRDGDINIVRDGNVDVIQLNPGFMTQPLIDRREAAIRQAGVPSQFSGQNPTGISTGRLNDQVLSASVDFPIQEYQEIQANMLQEANKRAIAVAKGWFGDRKQSFHVGFAGKNEQADYTPNTHFETDAHRVLYSAPGADANSLIVGIGQRVGIGTMSAWTAMQQDPLVPDADFEYKKVTSEKIQRALVEFVANAVAQGQVDPMDALLLWEEVEKGTNIADAWRKAQAAAQERQAAAQQAAAQEQLQSAPPGPESQPGLSLPGQEDPAGTAIGPPQPSQQNLAQLLGALRQPRPSTAPLAQPNAPLTPVK